MNDEALKSVKLAKNPEKCSECKEQRCLRYPGKIPLLNLSEETIDKCWRCAEEQPYCNGYCLERCKKPYLQTKTEYENYG